MDSSHNYKVPAVSDFQLITLLTKDIEFWL